MAAFSPAMPFSPLRRAPAELHADHDGDRGPHGLYPLHSDRCGSPDAPAAEPELRQAPPSGGCIPHRAPSDSCSFLCSEALHASLFSGSVIITFFFFFFFGGGRRACA